MARIRKVEIRNFRCIEKLCWCPQDGVNCLIGPGDSGKSTVLDAIDLCLGARRSAHIYDTDFHELNVDKPITIQVTIGALPTELKNLDVYGNFFRSFDPGTGQIQEEPEDGKETVLTVEMTAGADLNPTWRLVSVQADAEGLERHLRWTDRIAIAPLRLGDYLGSQFGWGKNSVLNRLADEPANLGPQLALAARQARSSFDQSALGPLQATLDRVKQAAIALGVPVGNEVQALLDAHALAISDGAVSLHGEDGVPLRSLGTGSSRLLVAGLQREAASGIGIVLIDEVEYGLEPHRLQRLLMSLGAKEPDPPLQVLMTTHSPVAVRELSAQQLWVLRANKDSHTICWAGDHEQAQATARATPEAMLAKTVILCEGVSEVGLVRGLDMYWASQGHSSLLADGAIAVSWDGGTPERGFKRGTALQNLGYRTLVLVDGDKPTDPKAIQEHEQAGGHHLQWEPGRTTEHELFMELHEDAITQLLRRAVELHSRKSISDQICSRSNGDWSLDKIEQVAVDTGYDPAIRQLLGSIAHKGSWFKTQGTYEDLARDIVGPAFAHCSAAFQARVNQLFKWAHEH